MACFVLLEAFLRVLQIVPFWTLLSFSFLLDLPLVLVLIVVDKASSKLKLKT